MGYFKEQNIIELQQQEEQEKELRRLQPYFVFKFDSIYGLKNSEISTDNALEIFNKKAIVGNFFPLSISDK